VLANLTVFVQEGDVNTIIRQGVDLKNATPCLNLAMPDNRELRLICALHQNRYIQAYV